MDETTFQLAGGEADTVLLLGGQKKPRRSARQALPRTPSNP